MPTSTIQPTILVVEDEAIVARDLLCQLRELGYRTVGPASTASDALAMARALTPDLVLMDIQLSGALGGAAQVGDAAAGCRAAEPASGVEAARAIRDQCGVPVVFLTAFADEKTLQQAKLAEPYGFLLKPLVERELRTVLEMALFKHQADARLRLMDAALQAVSQGVIVADASGRIVSVNDAFTEITGYSAAEVIGHERGFLLGPETDLRVVAAMQHALQAGEHFSGDIVHYRKDGTRFIDAFTVAPLASYSGRVTHYVTTLRDVTQRRQTEADLHQLADRFAQAVAGSADGLWDWDLATDEAWFSPRYRELLGYAADDPTFGSTFAAFAAHVHPDDLPAVQAVVARAVESGMPIGVECRMRVVDVGWRWFSIRGAATAHEAGRSRRMAGSLTDITARKRDAQALVDAMHTAQAASRAKSEFLATMSHEVRTPMNGVIGMTSMLLETALSAEQREYTEIIRNSGENLLAVINDILDFSRIESGRFELEQAEFDVRDCVDGVLELLLPNARAKSLSLRSDIAVEVPARVLGDATRLRQILFNLIGNALKFTHHGGVLVTLAAASAGEPEIELHVSVADTGIGIPAEAHATLFDAFMQVEASTTRKYGGTGLGLAITRRLAELMGGRVWLESEPGVGSTFHATLRVAPAGSHARAGEAQSAGTSSGVTADGALDAPGAQAPDLSCVRVLLAEDNLVNQRVALSMLQKLGCRADVVANGIEVLAALRHQRYDVVLMDVQMPEMDGLEATRQIVRDRPEVTMRPWIIALTANAMEGDRQKCLDAGMDDYVSKPMKREQIAEAIRRGLQART
jgi:PAS domain S-box-containing protein